MCTQCCVVSSALLSSCCSAVCCCPFTPPAVHLQIADVAEKLEQAESQMGGAVGRGRLLGASLMAESKSKKGGEEVRGLVGPSHLLVVALRSLP